MIHHVTTSRPWNMSQPGRKQLDELYGHVSRAYLSFSTLVRDLEAEATEDVQLRRATSLARLDSELSVIELLPLVNPADQQW